jgi:hypothetical protein
MPPRPLRIRCREIGPADIDRLADLLKSGFPKRTREFWVHALGRLTEHSAPPGFPKYGYLLECQGRPVGVLLLIWSTIDADGQPKIRCNVSSWYVEPDYCNYAGMLVSHALSRKHVTYLNITPNHSTLPILEAQGYTRYCAGRFIGIPALAAARRGWRVDAVRPNVCAGDDLSPFEIELLLQHAAYRCISVTCRAESRRHPFVFLRRRKAGVVPFAYLAYCRSLEEFVRFAGPLGRYLLWHGFPLVVVDANGPIEGLIGQYSGGAPKYFRGPDRPRLGDMAYSERVMFGF